MSKSSQSSGKDSELASSEKSDLKKMTLQEIEDLIVQNKEQSLGLEKNNEILLAEIRSRGVESGAEKLVKNESDVFRNATAPVSTAIVQDSETESNKLSPKSESEMIKALVNTLQKSNIIKNGEDSFIPTLWGNLEDDKGNPVPGPAAFFSAVERATSDPDKRLFITYKKSAGVARSILDAMMANETISYNDAKARLTDLCGTGLTERDLRVRLYTLRREKGETISMFGTRILSLGNALVNISRDNLLTRDEMLKDALSTFLPEDLRPNVPREAKTYFEYWKAIVKYINDRPYLKLRDEDILHEEGTSERSKRLKRIGNPVSAWNFPGKTGSFRSAHEVDVEQHVSNSLGGWC